MLKYSNATQDKIFDFINKVLLTTFAISCVYPFIYTLAVSVSAGSAVTAGEVILFPKGINWASFAKVLESRIIWTGYANTFFYTIVGTTCSMLLTIMAGYALSKRRLKGKKVLTMLVVFTMWFNIHVFGVIPYYLNLTDLHLTDSRFGIIVGFLCNAFNIILMRSYFESIPQDLEDCAKMDGASDWTILWKIYVPLSKPALATIALFYAVARWNGYFWSMVLLQDENKIPIQVYLKKVLTDAGRNDDTSSAVFNSITSSETITAAIIIVSIVPVILVYPFILKFFTKGTMLGGVKE